MCCQGDAWRWVSPGKTVRRATVSDPAVSSVLGSDSSADGTT